MEDNKKDIFENYPVPKAVTKLALPTTVGMLVMVVYNLVDTYFIGLTGDSLQVASVSIAMPVFLILVACGNLFGAGGSANISRSLGKKEFDKVKLISSFTVWSAVILGIIVGFIAFFTMDNIVSMIGADEESFNYVRGYLLWLFYGSVFLILSNTLAYLFRSEGNTKVAMFGMMIGTFTNVVLDPIFIFSLDYGVVGAAIATVVANFLACIYYVGQMFKIKDSYLSISIKDFKYDTRIAKDILVIGIPSSLNNILISIATIVYNVFLVKYGTVAVASMGIVIKLNMLCIMLFMGIGIGVQPLFGYTYGAKMYDRLKESIKFSTKIAVITGTICFIAYYFAPEFFMSIFINDPEVIEQGAKMLKAQVVTAPILGILFLTTYLMQVSNNSGIALLLSVCRQGLTFIPAVVLLDMFFGLEGLIRAQAIADVVSVILSIIFSIKFMRNLNANQIDNTDSYVCDSENYNISDDVIS